MVAGDRRRPARSSSISVMVPPRAQRTDRASVTSNRSMTEAAARPNLCDRAPTTAARPKRERWLARQVGTLGPLLDPLPANLVVYRYLPDLRLRDPRLLDRLPEPVLQEAVEVLARVPHVDDREAVVGRATDMEGLAFPQHTATLTELLHHGVVLVELTARNIDHETYRHVRAPLS